MQELKNCPFCAGTAKLIRFYPYFGKRARIRIECTKCRANSGNWGQITSATRHWNRRAADD